MISPTYITSTLQDPTVVQLLEGTGDDVATANVARINQALQSAAVVEVKGRPGVAYWINAPISLNNLSGKTLRLGRTWLRATDGIYGGTSQMQNHMLTAVDASDITIEGGLFDGGCLIDSGSPGGALFGIVDSTNASPIVVTTNEAHGMVSGQSVVITGVTVNTAANGLRYVTVLSPTTFSLFSDFARTTAVAGNGAHGATSSLTVSGATNATPIVLTFSANHGLSTGQAITVSGVTGNTNANGTSYVKVTGATTVEIYSDRTLATPRVGNGTFGGSPTCSVLPLVFSAPVGYAHGRNKQGASATPVAAPTPSQYNGIGLLLLRCRRVTVRDVSIRYFAKYGICLAGCQDSFVYGTRCQNYSDGVHIVGPWRNVWVYDSSGYTRDNMVAFTANDYSQYAYDGGGDGYDSGGMNCTQGFDPLNPGIPGNEPVRLVGGKNGGTNRIVRNWLFDGIYGDSFAGAFSCIDDGVQANTFPSDCDNIVVRNVRTRVQANVAEITLSCTLGGTFTFQDCATLTTATGGGLVRIASGGVVRQLIVDRAQANQSAGVCPLVNNDGTISDCVQVTNGAWRMVGSSAACIIRNSNTGSMGQAVVTGGFYTVGGNLIENAHSSNVVNVSITGIVGSCSWGISNSRIAARFANSRITASSALVLSPNSGVSQTAFVEDSVEVLTGSVFSRQSGDVGTGVTRIAGKGARGDIGHVGAAQMADGDLFYNTNSARTTAGANNIAASSGTGVGLYAWRSSASGFWKLN